QDPLTDRDRAPRVVLGGFEIARLHLDEREGVIVDRQLPIVRGDLALEDAADPLAQLARRAEVAVGAAEIRQEVEITGDGHLVRGIRRLRDLQRPLGQRLRFSVLSEEPVDVDDGFERPGQQHLAPPAASSRWTARVAATFASTRFPPGTRTNWTRSRR